MRRLLQQLDGWLPLLAAATWLTLVTPLARWPSGDGPHILGTAMRLAQLLRDGELALFWRCFSSLLAPHPPAAYLPTTLAYTVLGTTFWGSLKLTF